MFPLAEHTIFLTLAGSHAHGTSREGSDIDLRGICIAPMAVRVSLFRSFEQYEGLVPDGLRAGVDSGLRDHPTASTRSDDAKIECVVFELAKFLSLCAAANPNALEVLFADERDWVCATGAWQSLYDERRRFLTKKVQQTFLGYAIAQLRRIRTHRAWLLNPPASKPTREEFGLSPVGAGLNSDDRNRIEQSIVERIRRYGIDDVDLPKAARIKVQARLDAFVRDVLSATDDERPERLRDVATHALQLPRDVVRTLNAEKKFRAAMKRWESYELWRSHRNRARAELERRFGYDTKHAMHLIRLMRMGLEALETGDLRVRRPDAAELAAIRDGSLAFDDLLELAGELKTAMEQAASRTRLPADIDPEAVDALLLNMVNAA